MGEKDMSEKILEDYNDVFSDIVNVSFISRSGTDRAVST